MLARAMFVVATLLASPTVVQGGASLSDGVSQSVQRLLNAIKSRDLAGFTQVASHLVIMAAPDFAMPLTLDSAEKAFSGCMLVSLGNVYAAKNPMQMIAPGDKGSFVPTTLDCPTANGDKRVQVDFQADDHDVYVVYPGGMQALLRAAQSRESKPEAH